MPPLSKNPKHRPRSSKSDSYDLESSRSGTSRMSGSRTHGRRRSRSAADDFKGENGAPIRLTNSQVLEQEMMDDLDAELREEPVEIDLPKEAVELSTVYPDLSKRSSSPTKHDRSRSTSPQKQEEVPPPLPPKPQRTVTNEPKLREAFQDQDSKIGLSPEQAVIAASLEQQTHHDQAQAQVQAQETEYTAKPSKVLRRPPTAIITEDDYEPALGSVDIQAQNQLIAARNECKRLSDRVKELERELKDTQDFVFSMQPRAARLTESEALSDFKHLWGSVEEWVATHLGDAIEAIMEGTAKPAYTAGARRLLLLVAAPGREAYSYEGTDERNVMASIMKFLCEKVFDRDFYCDIEEGGNNFMKTVETAMRNLEPRRDVITYRTWRAETWLAITNRHNFVEHRSEFRAYLAREFSTMLHLFIPHADQFELERSIINAIVEPALQLAHKLHLSVDKYEIRWTPYHTASWEQRQAMQFNLSQYDCIDLLTERNVKFPTSGKIITYLFDLTPALVLRTAHAQYLGEPKVLKKARVLVAVTSEEKGIFDPRLPKHGEFLTVLARIENHFQRGRYYV